MFPTRTFRCLVGYLRYYYYTFPANAFIKESDGVFTLSSTYWKDAATPLTIKASDARNITAVAIHPMMRR